MARDALTIPDQPMTPGPFPARRVLIVNDSRMQRRILAASLHRLGYRVAEAASGRAALESGALDGTDIVVSDWVMPDMDGPELCRAVRQRGGPYVYFILLTSRSSRDEIARGLDLGADDFLAKPVGVQELRARISAGERILTVERALHERNRVTQDALRQLRLLYDALERDLREARRLQESLVRERHRSFPEGEVHLMLKPSGPVGGDLVGFYRIGDTGLGLYGIDVSGHGVASALLTARLAGYLADGSPHRNAALRFDAQGRVVARPVAEAAAALNRQMIEEIETGHYFTMVLAHVELASGRVELVQAGHPAPLVQGRDGRVRQIGDGGLPIGLMPDAAFVPQEFTLARGEKLLILSDGFGDCPGADGRLLGDAGVAAMVEGAHGLAGAVFLDALAWTLAGHAGGQEVPDDLSAAMFEYRGGPG